MDSQICRLLVTVTNSMTFAAFLFSTTIISSASEISLNSTVDEPGSALLVITDELEIGGFGPEMVLVPIAGEKVANCIAEEVCEDTITDIVRSMIAAPYAISKYEITFDDYDRFCEATGRT